MIGCGNISRFHFSGLEKAGAQVRWTCDLDAGRAGDWAEKTGARCTTDYREAMADPAVDLVVVTAISAAHKTICLDAIRAGKAVICEKTLAERADDALEIVRLAEAKGTIFYTSYMKRFIPAVEKAKELLPSLGRVLTTSIRAFQPWGDLWNGVPAEGFFHTPPGGRSQVVKNYGGGILVCGGSHLLDLVNFFNGRPTRLYASMVQPQGFDYDLQAAVLFDTPNGPVHWEALAHPLTKVGFLGDGWDEQVEITGTRGRLSIYSAKWDEVEVKASRLVHLDDTSGQATEYRYPAGSPFDRAVAFFCKNIEAGEQGSQSRLTGYEVDELIAHIQKSAAEGRAVDIEWRI
jgi:predicted dehydrogenase